MKRLLKLTLTLTLAAAAACASAQTTDLSGGTSPGGVKEPYPTPAPPPVPPVVDHSHEGPTLDTSKIPPPAAGFSTVRIESARIDPLGFYDPTKGRDVPGVGCTGWKTGFCQTPLLAPYNCVIGLHCQVRAGYETPLGGEAGAFRVTATVAKIARDDPIVYAGQPGASHWHTFYGATSVSAATTTLVGCSSSTYVGGTANCSTAWVPTLIDTATGAPVLLGLNTYYKTDYNLPLAARPNVQAIPADLRMVSGNAMNTDPTRTGAAYHCVAGSVDPGFSTTIARAVAKGTCVAGARFYMTVTFPGCWDGVNLDSPNHASHVASPSAGACPRGWVQIPVVTLQLSTVIPAGANVSKWRLASDPPTVEAGTSGHGDYWSAWRPEVEAVWLTNCVAGMRSAQNALCDGRTLY